MSNRAVYSIRCADGVVRSINEDDMAACLKHWGWLTPEEARRLRGVMRDALAACFDAGSSEPAMDALRAEADSWPSDEVTLT